MTGSLPLSQYSLYITSTPMREEIIIVPTCQSITLHTEGCIPVVTMIYEGELTTRNSGTTRTISLPRYLTVSWSKYKIIESFMNVEGGVQLGDITLLCQHNERADYYNLVPSTENETWAKEGDASGIPQH